MLAPSQATLWRCSASQRDATCSALHRLFNLRRHFAAQPHPADRAARPGAAGGQHGHQAGGRGDGVGLGLGGVTALPCCCLLMDQLQQQSAWCALSRSFTRSPMFPMGMNCILRTFEVPARSDGVLTPAISVVSAIQGIQFQTNISNGACGTACVGASTGCLALPLHSHGHHGATTCSYRGGNLYRNIRAAVPPPAIWNTAHSLSLLSSYDPVVFVQRSDRYVFLAKTASVVQSRHHASSAW